MSENENTATEKAKEQAEPEASAPTAEKASSAQNAMAMVGVTPGGIAITNLKDFMSFAGMIVSGGAAPSGMTTGQAAVAMQAGMQAGLGLTGGLQQCVVINGVVSWRGQGAYALIQNSGVVIPGTLDFWTEGEGEEMKGVAVAHRKGYAKPFRSEFTFEDARRAGLLNKKGPWQDYRPRQFKWRALGFLGRDYFSDVLGGFPLDVEAMDYEDLPPARATRADKPPALPSGGAALDPLLDVIGGKSAAPESEPEQPGETPGPAEPESVVDAEVIEPSPDTSPEPEPEPGRAGPRSIDDEPPFDSHEDADREIAQQDLFSEKRRTG